MFAFIDSSVLCTDYYMKGVNFELIKGSGLYIVLSEIVLDETKNKYKEMVENSIKKTNSGVADLQRLGLSIDAIKSDITEKTMTEYNDFIEMFLIESGMTIAEPYPKTTHDIIVKRALKRKKPFKSDGRNGYRDFLVWLTFLEMVRRIGNDADFFFITHNKHDFSDEKDENALHPDLLSDIIEMNLVNKRIQYYTSLKKFVDDVVKPQIDKVEEEQAFMASLLDNKEGFVSPVEMHVNKDISKIELCRHDINISGYNPKILLMDGVSIDEIYSISKVSDNRYLVTVKLLADCEIESYVLKTDLQALSKKEFKWYVVLESDWDNLHSSVLDVVTLHIDVDVLLDINDDAIVINALDITDISNGSCPYCPDYPDDDDDDEEDED